MHRKFAIGMGMFIYTAGLIRRSVNYAALYVGETEAGWHTIIKVLSQKSNYAILVFH